MKRLCVYCGSSTGASEAYADAARELAALLIRHDIELVYGGASRGIMGIIANAVLAGGGRVTGVIPRFLQEKEIAHRQLTELHVVESMHARKSLMAALADGFIALPGGFGDARGNHRDRYLGSAWVSRKTLWPAQHRWIFRSPARIPRPCTGRRIFAHTAPQHGAGGEHTGWALRKI